MEYLLWIFDDNEVRPLGSISEWNTLSALRPVWFWGLMRYMCYSDPLKVSWGQNIYSSLVAEEKGAAAQGWQSSQRTEGRVFWHKKLLPKRGHPMALGDQWWSSTPADHQRRGQLVWKVLALSWYTIPQLLYVIAPTARGWQNPGEAETTAIWSSELSKLPQELFPLFYSSNDQ